MITHVSVRIDGAERNNPLKIPTRESNMYQSKVGIAGIAGANLQRARETTSSFSRH
jgi:hypothetical protein